MHRGTRILALSFGIAFFFSAGAYTQGHSCCGMSGGQSHSGMSGHNHSGMSGMSMPKTESNTAVYTAPAAFRAQLDNVYAAYLALQSSLSKDDFGNVKPNAQNLIEALGLTDMKLLTDENAHKAWMSDSESLSQTAWQISVTPDLESARTAFRALSEGVITTAKQFGTPGKMTLYIFHCPMALNKTGADWVQGEKTTKNPYFGKTMLACGKVTGTIAAEGVK